jgi:hypothetical protein
MQRMGAREPFGWARGVLLALACSLAGAPAAAQPPPAPPSAPPADADADRGPSPAAAPDPAARPPTPPTDDEAAPGPAPAAEAAEAGEDAEAAAGAEAPEVAEMAEVAEAAEAAEAAEGAEANEAAEDPEAAAVAEAAAAAEATAVAEAAGPSRIRYTLERVEVRGNDRTDTGAILAYVPLRGGEVLDVDDPRVEAIRWRLLSTGWFDEVRLRLERGAERGHVVLVVEVGERNTFVVESIALGFSEGVLSSDDPDVQVEPYFGLSVAELNLFGTGVSLEATGLLSIPQQGLRLRAGQASVGGGDFGLSGSLFFNNGREFFGNDDVVIALDECPARGPEEPPCEQARNAVVVYRRYGASLGTGVDLATTLRFTLDWQFEVVEVVDRPEAASHRRGTEIVPIDFGVQDGFSRVSALRLGLAHDERDDPGLPTSGRFLFLNADVSTTLIGSSYDFVRVQAGWREWFRLPEARHTLRLGVFAGAAVGETPFFYRFYVADLSDLIPSRVLGLNLDRRAPPNLLDTSVREMRAQELAGRVDLEYSLWLWEGADEIRGLVVYGLVGVYALLDREDLEVAIPGYEGFARVPLDLTFDVGVRLDTVVGVFELGFSTLLGFVSL